MSFVVGLSNSETQLFEVLSGVLLFKVSLLGVMLQPYLAAYLN